MKLTELPIWPRILAAKPSKTAAKSPIGILRAVLAAGGLRVRIPYLPRPIPRSKRWTQSQREDLRAANDPKFRRALKRARATAKHERDLVMHIAQRYHHTIRALYTSKYAGIVWSGSSSQNVEWDRYAKSYKFPCKYTDAGVIADERNITISPTRGTHIRLPLPPKPLRRAAVLTEPHPVGLFAVPVKTQPGVFACMGVADAGWVVVGFAFKGHQVPECVGRGTITLTDIQTESNTEVQRLMIERYGHQRYIYETGAAEIQHDDFGSLYSLPGGAKLVRVINSTINPDGTANEYWLPVPSNIQTAHEAVAWTFGLTVETYQPAAQS